MQKLQQDLTGAQHLALSLDDKLMEGSQAAESLAQFACCITEKVTNQEQRWSEIQTKLRAYSQRIAYASSRVEVLQSKLYIIWLIICIHFKYQHTLIQHFMRIIGGKIW